jgi:hypothetical protein
MVKPSIHARSTLTFVLWFSIQIAKIVIKRIQEYGRESLAIQCALLILFPTKGEFV